MILESRLPGETRSTEA